jgi:DNA polymerase III subunit delta
LSLLISKTGNDLWRLNNEINKLIAAANGEIIDKDLISQLVKGDIEENIFALTDALVSKNNGLSLRLLEEQLAAGLSEEYILSMLQRQIKLMLEIKKLQTNNIIQERAIATALKVHPFVAKKNLQQSKNFSQLELEKYWWSLLELDFNNKQGQADIKSELYALIIN